MLVLTTVSEFHAWRQSAMGPVGFVPTMGALHDGHLSLAARCKAENGLSVVSIFVNPTQFNDPADLERYPRTLESDSAKLRGAGVDVLLFPSVAEVYPAHSAPAFDMDGLDLPMEGRFRPGHFNGVVQVVSRLFDIVQPHRAYFGEKDYQQLAIIRHMARKLGYATEVVGCPTLRETDGLAMSSRNVFLSESERKAALALSRALLAAKEAYSATGAAGARAAGLAVLGAEPLLQLEYFEVADADSLQSISEGAPANARALVAAKSRLTRLIDNMALS